MNEQSVTTACENEEKEELFQLVDGIRWLPVWGFESLHFAFSYRARPDDLFIVTYPRSGTTWMQSIIYNLQTDGQPFDANGDHFFDQNPTLELDGEEGIELMQRSGAIKTHLPIDRVPSHPQAKYICIIRNPKDVCVSYYLFYKMLAGTPKLNFDQFFQYFIKGHLPLGDYFEGLRSMWQRRHDPNVLLVSYEEMRTNFRSLIAKVANFLNIALNNELLERVLQYSSFEYMRNKFDSERRKFEAKIIADMEDKEVAVERQQKFAAESDMKIVRKGEINDWKSFLTSEQSRQIYDRFLETCQQCAGLENYWSNWNIF